MWVRLFRPKLDSSVIPVGHYCYVVDHERNKIEPMDGQWIKPCPYFKRFKNGNTACTYAGFIGFDAAHYDQCKICGENYGKDE